VSTAITIDSTYAEPFFAKSGILNRLMCMRRKWAELALKSVCAAPDKGRGEGSYRRVMRPITSSAPELSNSIAVYTHKSISRDSTISEADIQKRHIPPRKMNATPQTLTWRQLAADPDEDAVCTIYRPSGWVQLYPTLRREIVHHHSPNAESNTLAQIVPTSTYPSHRSRRECQIPWAQISMCVHLGNRSTKLHFACIYRSPHLRMDRLRLRMDRAHICTNPFHLCINSPHPCAFRAWTTLQASKVAGEESFEEVVREFAGRVR
jgi:hypothetical protein